MWLKRKTVKVNPFDERPANTVVESWTREDFLTLHGHREGKTYPVDIYVAEHPKEIYTQEDADALIDRTVSDAYSRCGFGSIGTVCGKFRDYGDRNGSFGKTTKRYSEDDD